MSEQEPEVGELLQQLQAQFENIGRVSSFVGFMNVEYLKNALFAWGWIARLAEDGKTVFLVPREKD